MDISKRLALYTKTMRTPYTCTDNDCAISIREKIIQIQRSADGNVAADIDTKDMKLLLIAIEDRLRQAEIRNTVAKHSADIALALKDCDTIAELCQLHRHSQAGRAGTDDGNTLSLIFSAGNNSTVKIRIGNIALNTGNLNRSTLDPLHAVTFALSLMVTDKGAENTERIILKKHLASTCRITVKE